MNVTFNTTNLNSSKNYNYSNKNKNEYREFSSVGFQPSFKGNSKFLAPLDRMVDSIAGFIAKHYTKHIYESSLARWLAKQGDKTGNIVDHMQTLGSIIISGMYMTQTLRNDNLDDKRKKTLAINQGLTFLASTAIAYLFEKLFMGPWDRHVTLNYAKNFLGRITLPDEYKAYVSAEKLKFEQEAANAGKEFKAPTAAKYIEKIVKNEKLSNKIKGLNVLRSLVIFGSVYRFLGPVAVTPVANMIGNKLFNQSADQKAEQKSQASVQIQRPRMDNLIK